MGAKVQLPDGMEGLPLNLRSCIRLRGIVVAVYYLPASVQGTHMRSDGTSKQRVEKSRRVYWFWVEKPIRI